MRIPRISISTASVEQFECDVLILKYAQGYFGADLAVASTLRRVYGHDLDMGPEAGQHVLLESDEVIAARRVLFVGVVPLYDFSYPQIRAFVSKALTILADERPSAKHVAMTMHGVGYGLDERESFLAQVGGIMDALDDGTGLAQISIVERNEKRAERLRAILKEALPDSQTQRASTGQSLRSPEQARSRITAGTSEETKKHIFVAMPFSKDLEDVYVFGIQAPINDAGFLCERVDMLSFTGDILERIKSRIRTATLVVADLSGANANVYLEVGYAWGKGRPTLLLSKKSEDLKFDVKSQRCVLYDSIVDLSKKMRNELTSLSPR